MSWKRHDAFFRQRTAATNQIWFNWLFQFFKERFMSPIHTYKHPKTCKKYARLTRSFRCNNSIQIHQSKHLPSSLNPGIQDIQGAKLSAYEFLLHLHHQSWMVAQSGGQQKELLMTKVLQRPTKRNQNNGHGLPVFCSVVLGSFPESGGKFPWKFQGLKNGVKF